MFNKKLNIRPNRETYKIEEKVYIKDGFYSDKLKHDNVVEETISVWTGQGMTGEKIEDFSITRTAEKEWETIISIMLPNNKNQEVFIYYDSFGDTVDADDINLLQDVKANKKDVAELEENLNKKISKKADKTYVDELIDKTNKKLKEHDFTLGVIDGEISIIKEDVSKKADKTYVDEQLNAKYDKSETYTREEVNERIANIIGNAPENLDTLEKLAQALDNDDSFASTITKELSNKVDKEKGKGLSTNDFSNMYKLKLDGIESGANKKTLLSQLKNDVGFITADDVPEVFHNAPMNAVTEDMIPSDFEYGVTICNQGQVNTFPTIKEYGVSITIRGVHASYAQLFITRFGDMWSRRSGVINEWNGMWYNSKQEIDNKANKDEVVTSVNGKTGDVTVDGKNYDTDISDLWRALNGKAFTEHTHMPKDIYINNRGDKLSDISAEHIDYDGWDNVRDVLDRKADKDKVVTSVNGQSGDITITGGTGGVESVNGQVGEVILDGSNIDVALETSQIFKSVTTTDIGGYGYIDSIIDSMDIVDGDLLLWDLTDMTDEDPFVKLDIYNKKGDRVVSSANIKDKNNVSLRQNDLYGYKNVLLEYQDDNGNLHVKEFNPSIQSIETKPLNDAINIKANKNEVVTSVNGKTGDVILNYDGESLGKGSRSSTIVIANYDSHENSIRGADIVIEEGENAAEKINEVIQSLKSTGGEVKLLEGRYNLNYGIAVNVPNVHLTGIPNATILIQNSKWTINPYNNSKAIIDTKSDIDDLEVAISNLYVKGAKIEESTGFYCAGKSQVSNCVSENCGGYGFYFTSKSQAISCTSIGSGKNGFNCYEECQLTNCTSTNGDNNGFYCVNNSKITNCISINNKRDGFRCAGDSQVSNCISDSNSGDGFYCTLGSQMTNCTSLNNRQNGINCSHSFDGVCSFNTLKNNRLSDNSIGIAVVEYNVIK